MKRESAAEPAAREVTESDYRVNTRTFGGLKMAAHHGAWAALIGLEHLVDIGHIPDGNPTQDHLIPANHPRHRLDVGI